MKLLDLTGKTVGRLTVIKFAGFNNTPHSFWLCKCDCGNEKIIRGYSLKSGNTKSCGCLNIENSKKSNTKHNKYGSREYITWKGMIQRCNNPKATRYKNWGGKGITICKRWEKFENFYEDMGKRPEGMTLDRIDNDGNYELKNCKWATSTEQNNNKG